MAARLVGRGPRPEEGQHHYEQRLGAWRAENPATGFQNATAPIEALLTLSNEAEFYPFGISAVTCRDCGRSATGARWKGKSKIKHQCDAGQGDQTDAGDMHHATDTGDAGGEDDMHDTNDANDANDSRDTRASGAETAGSGDPHGAGMATGAKYLRLCLDETVLNWAGDAAAHECFAGIIQDLPVTVVDTGELLRRAGRDLSHWGWADVVPPQWENLQLPPLVVHQDATDGWKLANAIGIALSRSDGRPDLERHACFKDVGLLRRYLRNARDLAGVFRCSASDCEYARPYRVSSHDCVDATGTNFPSGTTGASSSKKVATIRQSRKMERVSDVSFHDLPAKVKAWAWASFCSSANQLEVKASLFAGNSSDSLSPFAPAFVSPGFGPQKITQTSNQKAPSKRKQERSARLAEASGSGQASAIVAADASTGATQDSTSSEPAASTSTGRTAGGKRRRKAPAG